MDLPRALAEFCIWQDGIDILKDSGTAGRLFARHSEGVVDTLGSQVDAIRHPLRTAKASIADYVSAGKSDWRNWDPGYYMGSGIGQGLVNFGKDIYHSDWDSVAYKAGGLTTGVAEAGIASWASEAIVGRLAAKGSMPQKLEGSLYNGDLSHKPFNANQSALIQMGKQYDKLGGISMPDAQAYVSLASEVNLPLARIDMGHSIGGAVSRNPHLHIGAGSYHVPILPE